MKTFPMAGADGVGRYITKNHPDSPRKIDLTVAAVIAYERANGAEPASVYESRGVISV